MHLHTGRLGPDTAPPQCHMHTRHKFFQRERFDDVVVAARGEALDSICGRMPSSQKQHWRFAAVRSQSTQHVESITIRQHHIEHHSIGTKLVGFEHSFLTGRRSADLATFKLEGRTDEK